MADDGKIDHTDTIFIGGVNFTMTEEEFMSEVMSWENVVSAYYPGPTKGWGTAKFATPKARTDFLERKQTFVLGNKIVDVKPFKRQKYKSPLQLSTVSTLPPLKTAPLEAPIPAQLPSNILVGMTQKPKVSANVLASSTSVAITGAILRFVGTGFAIIKTNSSGSGILCEDVLYMCSNPEHNLACKSSDCPTYVKFAATKHSGKRLSSVLQLGTQLSFAARKINYSPEYTFQVTLAWPQSSKKPSKAVPLDPTQSTALDDQLKRFYLEEKRATDSNYEDDVVEDNGRDLIAYTDLMQMFKIMNIPTDNHLMRQLLEEMYHLTNGKDVRDVVINFYRKRRVELSKETSALLFANGQLLLQAAKHCNLTNNDFAPGAPSLSSFYDGGTDHSVIDVNQEAELLSRKFSEFLFNATTANGYFDFIKDKSLVRKHCVLAVDLWKKLGYPLIKLQYEYRDSSISNTLEFLPARWKRIMENVSDEHVDCMIEPSHLLQLTIQFFEREFDSIGARNVLVTSIASAQGSSRAPTPLGTQITRTESPVPQSVPLSKRAGRLPQIFDPPEFIMPQEQLNSLIAVYKSRLPATEVFISKIKTIMNLDNDLLQYKEFMQWLSKLSSSNLYVNVDSPECETLFVYQTTRALTSFGANPKDIMSKFVEKWAEPKRLFYEWGKLINSDQDMWAPEAVLRITSRYCFETYEGTQKYHNISSFLFKLYETVSYVEADKEDSPAKFFNLRGIVIQVFNDSFGVIQTPVGRVLFDCNIVFSRVGNSWSRTGPEKMPLLHSFVKLHARAHRLRPKSKEEYLYATKVWEYSESHGEPFTGCIMLGQTSYLLQVQQELSSIAKANISVLFCSADLKSYSLDYVSAFQNALKVRFESTFDIVGHSESDPSLRGYRPFLKYLKNIDGYQANNQEYLAALKALATSPNVPSFSFLQNLFITYEALDMIENFQELVETTLLSSQEKLGPITDVAHLLLDYFRHDRETQSKFETALKMFRDPSNLEQILQYFSNVVNKVYAEKESNQSFFDDGMESQAVALSGYSSHLRKASNEEAKDGYLMKELQLLQNKIGELMNFKEATGNTVTKLVEAVTTLDMNVKVLLDVMGKQDFSNGPLKRSTAQKVQYVRVILEGRSDICEIPTSESGNLSVDTLSAVFPGATALLYKVDSGNFRICIKDKEEFLSPPEGWRDTIYTVKILDVSHISSRQISHPISSLSPNIFSNSNGISQRHQSLGGRY